MDFTINKKRLQFKNTKVTVSLGHISLGINEGGKGGGGGGGGMDHVS